MTQEWLARAIQVYMEASYPQGKHGITIQVSWAESLNRYWNTQDSERLAHHILGNWQQIQMGSPSPSKGENKY